ncbi:hypothetical protein Tco_0117323 [Tanacetum coccineum]
MVTYLKHMVQRKDLEVERKHLLGKEQVERIVKKQKLEDDTEKEELKAYLDIVPGDEIAMEFESLATKYPIIDWKTHSLSENMMYYQIIRANKSSKNYKIFSEMLDDFDRQDVIDLHRLVQERIVIHMMIEKKYPLTQEMLSRMLSRRLEVDHESEMAFELLKFTRSQLKEGDSGPDFSFDKSASLERLFGLARVSLAGASKLDLSFGWSGGDYTSSCPPSLIPSDLHPRLLSEEFRMPKLSDNAIGPLGLNKVITFEVLCRSLQIEPMMTLFRVFQTLCKQGDWFSFAKRRAPSLVCIDDNRSCMKHMKSGFFLINRWAIPDSMVWRHPNATIDDPWPAAGSFSMAHSRVYDPVLRGANRNVIGIHDFLCLPEWTGAEVREEPHLDDLAIGTSSSKILAKVEASQKRKASTSGATLSHVAKCTRSALAQSSGSTTRPSLFVGDSDDKSDGDDDSCVEILLVTPLCFAAVIPSLGNQGWSSTAPIAQGSNTRDSRGKGIMAADAAAPSVGATQPRPSSGPAPSFRDVFDGVSGNYGFTREEWDAPYRPTFGVLTKEVFKDHAVCKTVVDQFPTPDEMVQVEELSED